MRLFGLAAAFVGALTLAASAQDTSHRQVLPQGVTPVHYALTVTPDAAHMAIAGDVRIDINVAAPTSDIVINANDLTFDSVTLDTNAHPQVTFDAEQQTARLHFAQPVAAGAHALAISYHGKIYRSAQGMFAYNYTSAHGPETILTTQFEAADARRFVPCFDQPDLKAVWDVAAIVAQDRTVISNMPVAGTDQLQANMKRVRFASTPKMSSYLLFMGVGDLERITTTVDGVEIGVVTKRGDVEKGRFALDAAAQLLRYYNDYFGVRYPLPKLDLVAAPGGGGFSAMENWGAILYFENALLVDPQRTSERDRQEVFIVVAHEMAHQWFGDLVTMKWWDDIWLNEGFASWMESKATEHFHPEWHTWMQYQSPVQEAMDLDARASTHPIVQPIDTVDQANNAFDRITYHKGRMVIRMVEMRVGDDHFRDGVRAYIRDHAYGTATTAELWQAIETASGTPMRQMATDFTFQSGVPLMRVDAGACAHQQRTVTVHQDRFGLDDSSKEARTWHTPIQARVSGQTATLDGGVIGDDRVVSFTEPSCAPFILNPDQASYYRTLYTPALFAQLARNFANVAPADQLGLLYDARALGQTPLQPYTSVFDLIDRTPRTADRLVWTLVARQIDGANSLYDGLPTQAAFAAFGRRLLEPVFAQVGWEAKAGEDPNIAVLREQLITTLSGLQDPAVEAEARRRFTTDTIPGPVREATLEAVGRGADQATFDALLAHARATHETLEKAYAYDSLAYARDPALAQRALSLAFDADVPASTGRIMIVIVSLHHTQMAWDFAAAHRPELAERLDSLSNQEMIPSLASRGADPAMLQSLRSYLDQQVSADVRPTMEVYYLRLADRVRQRQQFLPQVDSWLRAHRH
ncbi:MAG: M1 family metallopeptidase [Pseudomonadota bacterium]